MYVNREGRQGKNTDLSREVSQAASSDVVTTNCEKSAEAIVGEIQRAEQCNSADECMYL